MIAEDLRRGAVATLLLCAASGGAAAWERPTAAQPVPKAEACPEMGEGFVRVPGSFTCVRLSGSIRVEASRVGGGASFTAGH